MTQEQEVTIEGRKFRPIVIGHNWAKSQFEYFNEIRSEWRRVNNWDRRETLFSLFSGEAV